MNARSLSAEVLRQVWGEEAFAAAALSLALSKSNLEARDRGLATEICYGVLRTQPYLERRLGEYGKIKSADLPLLSHLLVAAYQIEFLDRVPARAAVNEAVQLITEARDKRVGGFANAILRALSRDEKGQRLSLQEAAFSSSPSWVRKRLLRDIGEAAALSLLVPSVSPRPYLRVCKPELLPWLEEKTTPCEGLLSAYRYEGGGDPRSLEGFAEGGFVVQELGAQIVAHAAGAEPGERVLDACAGRGQKTSLLSSLVGPGGTVLGTDLHEHKVRALSEEMNRVGAVVETRACDWTQKPEDSLLGSFDRVLVDAPCSGVGTLRRRPEIARRLTPDDPARLGKLQLDILRNAALAVRPGGTLTFATCSVLREEAEAVVEAFLAESSSAGQRPVESIGFPTGLSLLLFPNSTPENQVRLLPEIHGTDGYFIASFRVS